MGSNAFLSNRRNAIALVGSFLIECFLRWVSSILLPQLSIFLSTPLQRFCTYQSFFIIRSQTQSASVTSKSSFFKLSEASPIPSYCYLWKGISSVISALLEASKSSSCSQVEVSGTDCSPWQTQPCRQGLTQTHSSSLLLSPLLAPLTYSELYDTAVTWVYSTYLPFPSSKAAVSSLILTEVPQFMTIFSWGSGLALAADSENSMQPSISNS